MFIRILKFLDSNKYTIGLFLSVFLCTFAASAETFDALNNAGKSIFAGLYKIIAPAATIGIACCCIAGMFGSFNWKWFAAISIGVFVMSWAATSLIGANELSADLIGVK